MAALSADPLDSRPADSSVAVELVVGAKDAGFTAILTMAEREGLVVVGSASEDDRVGIRLGDLGAEMAEQLGVDPMSTDAIGSVLGAFTKQIEEVAKEKGLSVTDSWRAVFG